MWTSGNLVEKAHLPSIIDVKSTLFVQKIFYSVPECPEHLKISLQHIAPLCPLLDEIWINAWWLEMLDPRNTEVSTGWTGWLGETWIKTKFRTQCSAVSIMIKSGWMVPFTAAHKDETVPSGRINKCDHTFCRKFVILKNYGELQILILSKQQK